MIAWIADAENDVFATLLGSVKSGLSVPWNGWSVKLRLTVWDEG